MNIISTIILYTSDSHYFTRKYIIYWFYFLKLRISVAIMHLFEGVGATECGRER